MVNAGQTLTAHRGNIVLLTCSETYRGEARDAQSLILVRTIPQQRLQRLQPRGARLGRIGLEGAVEPQHLPALLGQHRSAAAGRRGCCPPAAPGTSRSSSRPAARRACSSCPSRVRPRRSSPVDPLEELRLARPDHLFIAEDDADAKRRAFGILVHIPTITDPTGSTQVAARSSLRLGLVRSA